MRVVICDDMQKDMGTIRRELDAYSTVHPKYHVGIDEYDAETDALHRMEKEKRRHSKRKFVLLSCLYAAGFVSMGAYMYTVSGITMLLTYLGVAVYLFLFSILSQRNVFLRKAFCFLLILACFPS